MGGIAFGVVPAIGAEVLADGGLEMVFLVKSKSHCLSFSSA
jgi:hypothetical protein